MNKTLDDLARELAFRFAEEHCYEQAKEAIQAALQSAADAEREACAKVCEKEATSYYPLVQDEIIHAVSAAVECADLIRQRGEG